MPPPGKIGAGRGRVKAKPGDRLVVARHLLVSSILALSLAGCQSLFGSGGTPGERAAEFDPSDRTQALGYPDLSAIPPSAPSEQPLEERRQIVRDLIENRDLAHYKKTVVRHRSGLSATPPPAAPALSDPHAEEIIRGAPVEGEQTADAAGGDDDASGTAYRQRPQFDDGTLDDFIRRLKRDTAPAIPEPPLPVEDDKTSFLFKGEANPAWQFMGRAGASDAGAQGPGMAPYQPVVLRALAAPVLQKRSVFAVRLAAVNDEPGFFCSYLGWMVAWSNACIEDSAEGSDSGDVTVGVDESGTAEDGTSTKSGERSVKQEGSEKSEEEAVAESDRSADDEVAAAEDLDDEPLVPVASALDRLRKLLRSRSRREGAASDPKSLSYEPDALKPPEDVGPPRPRSRPEVEQDFQIVRNDVLFEFHRTPRPAFKPTPLEPATVIFPPTEPRRGRNTTIVPKSRPELSVLSQPDPAKEQDDPVEQQLDTDGSATAPVNADLDADLDAVKALVTNAPSAPVTVAPVDDEDGVLLDSEVIPFDPASAQLPMGIEIRLAAMLKDAKAKEAKLFIVSEARVGRLAMERARSVGLALVRLGATADLIEYDIVVARGADQLQVLMKPAETEAAEKNGASGETAAGDLDKVK